MERKDERSWQHDEAHAGMRDTPAISCSSSCRPCRGPLRDAYRSAENTTGSPCWDKLPSAALRRGNTRTVIETLPKTNFWFETSKPAGEFHKGTLCGNEEGGNSKIESSVRNHARVAMADGNNKLAEIMARKKAARAAALTDAPLSREGSGISATTAGHVRQSSNGALQPN